MKRIFVTTPKIVTSVNLIWVRISVVVLWKWDCPNQLRRFIVKLIYKLIQFSRFSLIWKSNTALWKVVNPLSETPPYENALRYLYAKFGPNRNIHSEVQAQTNRQIRHSYLPTLVNKYNPIIFAVFSSFIA